MKNKLISYPKTVAFLCGWLAVAALPPFFVWPVLLICVSVLLWLINRSNSAKKSFGLGYSFGFAFFAFGLSWINNALLIEATTFGWLIPITFVASGAFFGLFAAIPAWLCWYVRKPILQYLLFTSLFVLCEWVRSFFLTGFPWNLLGTTLAFSDTMIQLASIGGTYLLSLMVLLVAGIPFVFLNIKGLKNRVMLLSLVAILIGGIYGFGWWRLNKHPYEKSDVVVRLVQPAIPQSMKWNPAQLDMNLQKHIKMSQYPSDEKINFIVWGETAFPYSLEFDDYQRSLLQYAIPEKTWLLTGGLRYKLLNDREYEVYNSLFVVDDKTNIVDSYDKSHLVPFGEYVPLREYLPKWARPIASAIGNFRKGNGPKVMQVEKLPKFGGLVCYEVIFPHEILNQNNRPDWLVNITNDGWYGKSAGPYQHLVATKMRAVEEGVTIVRVAGSGISALVDPVGRIIKQIGLHQEGIADVNLPKISQFTTLYSCYGNLLIVGLCLVLVVLSGCSYNMLYKKQLTK